ncbi:penicillin-binding protein 6 [Kerstersia gyiorum]|uniref:serine-type D-Ala-D-Ala carboxypeptidase n=1 Tax=Kerstersia gyiorum TaxID=206506 RepID=A0A4Q7MWB3_9BURK|nr:D-alanyl-D-alanine carboxypeptidase [Kerstersia gyiorum]RZS73332.1 penicillin-binding protein 6 [Kerstersia gyiorum]
MTAASHKKSPWRPVRRTLVTLALAAAPLLATAQTTAAQAPGMPAAVAELSSIPAPVIAARAWISIDVTSGQVLAGSQPDMRVEPASLTKVMTAYLAFAALDEKRVTADQQVAVSQHAWKTGGSRMFIEPRKPVTFNELLQGMIVQSGNDASVAVAETIAGSEAVFADLMNKEAKRLGMTDSHFMNATGLPDPQHTTTVRDLATLATALIRDYPQYFGFYKQREFTYNNITQPNRNRLLWADPSVDGMKTGFTDAAGYCLIATAMRGDRRILTVVVGTDSDAARAEESLKLLNWSFQNFDTVKVFADDSANLVVPVREGKEDTVQLGTSEPLWLSVPRGRAQDVKPVASRPDPLLAPLHVGQEIGTVSLSLDDKVLTTAPLVVKQDVERAGFFGRLVDNVKSWFD